MMKIEEQQQTGSLTFVFNIECSTQTYEWMRSQATEYIQKNDGNYEDIDFSEVFKSLQTMIDEYGEKVLYANIFKELLTQKQKDLEALANKDPNSEGCQ